MTSKLLLIKNKLVADKILIPILIAPMILLLVTSLAAAQSSGKVNVITISAIVKPDNSNQFIHNQFAVKTFKFMTTDPSICPGVTIETMLTACKYSLQKGEWRANMVYPDQFVFDGSLKASSNMNSKFFEIRADLTKTAESTATGHLVQNLTGSVSFGNGVPDYGLTAGTFDATNNTIKLGGASIAANEISPAINETTPLVNQTTIQNSPNSAQSISPSFGSGLRNILTQIPSTAADYPNKDPNSVKFLGVKALNGGIFGYIHIIGTLLSLSNKTLYYPEPIVYLFDKNNQTVGTVKGGLGGFESSELPPHTSGTFDVSVDPTQLSSKPTSYQLRFIGTYQ
jgi:hypothetical protein